ncbi:hypothetical protein B0H16DRAFT_131023 [Mycena metata]|uniref:Uncharacterized protein n=1 Tax=Mycena metata TaxID=1033252 RepID=A0AAD7MWS9_9AGAR|nr:hypothetical protein B0H16DRAFT_131023 [Mycena metata]
MIYLFPQTHLTRGGDCLIIHRSKCVNDTQDEDLTVVQAKINNTTEFQNGSFWQSVVVELWNCKGRIAVSTFSKINTVASLTASFLAATPSPSPLPPPSMNTETYPDDEDIPTPPDEYTFTSSGGGMFSGSHHFTLAGGTFNNYVAAPALPLDFRMIPMGDIDLQQEQAVNKNLGVVGRRRDRNSVRRVYSAKIEGRNSKVTAAVYQGDGAEEDWRREREMYMSVR